MNFTEFKEVKNGEKTYKGIADILVNECGRVLIGWTDEEFDHRDILFVFRTDKVGSLQSGRTFNDLFIGIASLNCEMFRFRNNEDNRKADGYLKEKLRLHDNHCDDAICTLINGVIHEMDILLNNGDSYEEN